MPSFIEAIPELDRESIPGRARTGSVARLLGPWVTAALAWMVPAFGAGAQEPPWEVETWQVPFDYSSPSRAVRYEPLERATRKWRICASCPHLKDSYWLSVNYGMVLEAERLGVALQVVEAGGYTPSSPARPPGSTTAPPVGPTFSWSEPSASRV